ncbi:restriction endonuclease subunit S [Halomonas hibernica]|uniref:restriction endonuclease subunit S n=1 Tax=Halomonas hibernica TaxID=2591147 RepID=UPI0015558B12|nr:restriction endonuclease subunit S [Halomonas hibernica]
MTDPSISRQWLTISLENVILRIVGGGTPSKSKPEYYQGEIPWMSVKDMNKHVLEDTVDHISQAAVTNSSTNVIPAGTPIIATRMSLGKVVVANFDSAINQDLKALFLPAEIHRDYLVYWYRSVARKIEQMGTGTTVKGIRLETLKDLEFALPPLAEQKVIADKLDTLLTQVENTKARLVRIPQILKRFRQSVLVSAMSGRLTGVTCVGLGALKSVADIASGVAFKKAQYSNSGSKLLQIANVGYGETKWDSASYIPPDLADEFSTYALAEGDIVMALNRPITNDTLKVAVVSVDDMPATLYQRVARVRTTSKLLDSRYLFLLMQGPNFRKNVELNLKGSDQPYLNTSSLGTFEIRAPDLQGQTEIIRQVDQLFAHADRIEQQVNTALARVNNLTQSILAKAFRGELTEQWRKDNPELISGEKSAEALLERIKTERAAMKKPAKKTRKQTTA